MRKRREEPHETRDDVRVSDSVPKRRVNGKRAKRSDASADELDVGLAVHRAPVRSDDPLSFDDDLDDEGVCLRRRSSQFVAGRVEKVGQHCYTIL